MWLSQAFWPDANYNVVALTDKTGWVVEHYEYDPYGRARIHRIRLLYTQSVEYWTNYDRSPSANPFTFTGRWLDAESGLMYYRARPYGPTLGRFVTQDPMGALATVPTELTGRGAAALRSTRCPSVVARRCPALEHRQPGRAGR